MLVVGGVGLLGMSVVVPGLLGTIKGLFLNAGSDPSTQGRTADYAPVLRYVAESPLSGRGFGTFIPGIYRTLDNQYLGLLVETGVLGVLAFLMLVVGTVVVAGQVRRRSTDDQTRDLAQCLKAGIVVIAVDAATFDALGLRGVLGAAVRARRRGGRDVEDRSPGRRPAARDRPVGAAPPRAAWRSPCCCCCAPRPLPSA